MARLDEGLLGIDNDFYLSGGGGFYISHTPSFQCCPPDCEVSFNPIPPSYFHSTHSFTSDMSMDQSLTLVAVMRRSRSMVCGWRLARLKRPIKAISNSVIVKVNVGRAILVAFVKLAGEKGSRERAMVRGTSHGFFEARSPPEAPVLHGAMRCLADCLSRPPRSWIATGSLHSSTRTWTAAPQAGQVKCTHDQRSCSRGKPCWVRQKT
jgi:hypothetical protein